MPQKCEARLVDAPIGSIVMPANYSSKLRPQDLSLNSQQTYEDLKSQGFRPRLDVKSWPFVPPVDWAADPFQDRNWQFQLHAWRGVDPIIKRYLRSDDAAFLEEAISFAIDWHRHHEMHGPAKFSWYDMATGLRATKLAFYLDQVFAGKVRIPDEAVETLLALADEHARRLMVEKFISLGNHGLFQVLGLDLLCSVLADRPSCAGGQEFARMMFGRIMQNSYTPEGVHKEHSPYYHYFTTATIKRLNIARLGDKQTQATIEQADRVQPWLVWPNGRFVEVGDSEGKEKPLSGVVDKLVTLEPGNSFAVGDFSRSGYIVIRSDPSQKKQPSMLFVTGMSYSNAHKHADELSFALYEHGQQIFIDSGKYGFNRDRWRSYFTSSAAHNTIALVERPVTRSDVERKGAFLDPVQVTDGRFRVSGRVIRPALFKQERSLEYQPGRSLLVHDKLFAKEERTFVSSLHFDSRLQPQVTGSSFDLLLPNGQRVRGMAKGPDCQIELVRGQEKPALGWQSAGYLKKEPTSVVRALCRGVECTITWSIDLNA